MGVTEEIVARRGQSFADIIPSDPCPGQRARLARKLLPHDGEAAQTSAGRVDFRIRGPQCGIRTIRPGVRLDGLPRRRQSAATLASMRGNSLPLGQGDIYRSHHERKDFTRRRFAARGHFSAACSPQRISRGSRQRLGQRPAAGGSTIGLLPVGAGAGLFSKLLQSLEQVVGAAAPVAANPAQTPSGLPVPGATRPTVPMGTAANPASKAQLQSFLNNLAPNSAR